jgi:hypothetical protein
MDGAGIWGNAQRSGEIELMKAFSHHVSQRGNVRQYILPDDADRIVYLDRLQRYCQLHELSLLGHCLVSCQLPFKSRRISTWIVKTSVSTAGPSVSCRCHLNGEKDCKKRIKKEKRRKIWLIRLIGTC